MIKTISVFFTCSLLLISLQAEAQKSFFNTLNQTIKDADKAFIAKNYSKALSIYEELVRKQTTPENINLRLARSYYFTFQYEQAARHYNLHEKTKLEFPVDDYFYFAEALTSIGEIKQALRYYQLCLDDKPDNDLYIGRIWRLNNLSYLYEDSLENMVHRAKLNSNYSELQVVQIEENQVYLVSNQPQVDIIKKIDSKENSAFYNVKKIDTYEDPFSMVALNYENPQPSGQALKAPFHISAISIFDDGKKMIYSASSKVRNEKGNYPLQLYFAKKQKNKWVKFKDYEHNNLLYDLCEPSMSNDGKTLIFSANFDDGLGGKDLYKSTKTEKGWTKPESLGNSVNTERDERFPFINNSTLYFASNGHAGLGGFDVYKAKLMEESYQDLENLGYPINSSYDELSFNIDSLAQVGFLSSNRQKGGFDFDIFEFALDLQIYPLMVEGVVKFIEHNWMDSTELKVLPKVEMELTDRTGGTIVATSTTDLNGNFILKVPYYSKFKIRIKGDNLDGFVSFEVPKFAKQDLSYEIVVVNDDFKTSVKEENE
jgi:tetratricopeptide (TPR) repeat protein